MFTQQKKVHKARQQYVWRRTLRKNKTHFRNDRILDYLFVKEREGLRERLNKRKRKNDLGLGYVFLYIYPMYFFRLLNFNWISPVWFSSIGFSFLKSMIFMVFQSISEVFILFYFFGLISWKVFLIPLKEI